MKLRRRRGADAPVPSFRGCSNYPASRHTRPFAVDAFYATQKVMTLEPNPRWWGEKPVQPDDFRTAASRLPNPDDLALAVAVFSVIGGVVGYSTEMTNFDLPAGVDDFDRWVAERVLSPAAPLHYEATTLLAKDPTLAGASALLHHATLGGVPHHIGPSHVVVDGRNAELDVVVAGVGDVPGERTVLAIGEAKAGETLGAGHLARLERVRAAGARLLMFGVAFTDALVDDAGQHGDVELVGLERLHRGG